MKTRSQFAAVAIMLFLLLPSLNAAPAGIRPGPPPDPLGARPVAAASAADRVDEARKPGPPPDPLREGCRA